MHSELATRDPDVARRARRFLVVWQNPIDRKFIPVGDLEVRIDDVGIDHSGFTYRSSAASEPGFRPLLAFPDLGAVYERHGELLPFFANRVMSPRRPDYEQYVTALGLTAEADPLEILARSGGERATDTIQVVPYPEVHDDVEHRLFLVSGVRHAEGASDRVTSLRPGQELQLTSEPSNAKNPKAVLLDVAAGEPVGWVPDYLLDDLHKHLEEGHQVRVVVEHANGPEVPWHLRLLCRMDVELGS